MTKKTSIVILSVVIAIALLLGAFMVLPKGIEYGEYKTYTSPFQLLQKDDILGTSLTVTYDVDSDSEDFDIQSVKKVAKARLEKVFGLYGCDFEINNSEIAVTIPRLAGEQTNSAVLSLLDSVLASGKVELGSSQEYNASSILYSSEDFAKATTTTYVQSGTSFNVCEVTFTKEAKKDAKYHLSVGTPYYYFVDGVVTYYGYYQGEKLQLYAASKEDAQLLASYVNTGSLDCEATRIGYVRNANRSFTFGLILGLVVLACFLFLVIKYKWLGFAASASQMIALDAFIAFAGLVHFGLFNLAAYIGVLLTFAFMTAASALTLDKIVAFGSEKTFGAAKFKGFSAMNKLSLIAHAGLLVLGVILWVIPTGVTAPLGNALVYGAVLSFVATMGLNRLFVAVASPLAE